MKITGLCMREQHPHVEVLEVAELSLPLSYVVHEELASLEDTGLPVRPRPPRRGRRGRYGFGGHDPVPGPVTLADGRRGEPGGSFTGLVVHRSRSALIDYLLLRWDPCGDDEIDDRIRVLRRSRRPLTERRIAMEGFLTELEERCGPASPPLVEADTLDVRQHGWEPVQRDGRTIYFRSRSEALVLTIDREVSVAGVPVLDHEWLVVASGPDRAVLHLDRGVTRRYERFDQVPRAVRHRFDGHGRAWPAATRGQVPLAELWPRFLVRVPQELDTARGATPPDPALPPCYLVEPWRVGDPARLTADLPLIDDPAAARAVLARTVEGVYLPGNPPVLDLSLPAGPLLVGALPLPPAQA
jgi:hypothetical protein